MAKVIQPKPRQSGLNTAFNLAKIGGGIASGKPMGYLGAAEGAMNLQGNQQAQAAPMPSEDSAVSRRLQQITEPIDQQLIALRDGEIALNQLPQQIRQQYGRPLFETIIAAHKQFTGGKGGQA